MNALTEHKPAALVPSDPKTAVAEVLQHSQLIQQVLKDVMKKDIHYGVIPGTDKPTLLQPGADVLAMTFRIAHELESEDLSTQDVVRYRVKCRGRHQVTGVVLGEGVGECSGAEEKYRWRRSVCDEEFNATPATLRRVKYGRKGQSFYTINQVRTDPADAANTVLKMAVKRAKIAMILNVTGASAVFGQDLEDLPEELRDAFNGKAPAPTVVEMTAEQRALWEAESRKGRKAARAFWNSLPQNVRDGVSEEDKAAMWALAEGADQAPAPPAPAAAPAPTPTAAPEPAAAAPAPAPASDDDKAWLAQMEAAEKAGAANA